jgi:hypothetical protein
MERNPFSKVSSCLDRQNSPSSTESENSVLFRKNYSHPEPDKSNPYLRTLFFNINYNIVLPSKLLSLKLSLLFRFFN